MEEGDAKERSRKGIAGRGDKTRPRPLAAAAAAAAAVCGRPEIDPLPRARDNAHGAGLWPRPELRRGRPRKTTQQPPPPPRSAHETAVEAASERARQRKSKFLNERGG